MKTIDIRTEGLPPLGSIVTYHEYGGTTADALVIGYVVTEGDVCFLRNGRWEYCVCKLNLLTDKGELVGDVGKTANPSNPIGRTWSPNETPTRRPGDVFYRIPTSGYINNCALANGDEEGNCQVCDGTCPDRKKFGKPG